MSAPDDARDPPVVDLTVHPSPHPFVRRGLVRGRPRLRGGRGVVTMRAPDGQILGDAFWNDTSDIALRRLTTGDVRFDRATLAAALDRAVALRASVPGLTESSDAWRVVHAEGDELSGLVVDRFGDVVVVQLHSAGWLPWADELPALLHERLGTKHHRVVLDERTAHLEGARALDVSSDGCPTQLKVREHGVRWQVDLATGHKTGFFCDQRENRRELARWVDGKRVLDVCCYTGGFAVAASVLGEPAEVTAVDLDEKALAVARRNANLNQVRVGMVHADAFDWLRQVERAGRRYEVVVVDPPRFIPTRRDVERGRGKYHDLNRLAVKLVEPGGLMLTCSCSGLLERDALTELVRVAARKEGRRCTVVAAGGAGPDHPVHLECPESSYLKTLWMRVW